MKRLFSIVLVALVACGSENSRRDVSKGVIILEQGVRVIKLDPDPDRKILFSQIVDDINIVLLETNPNSLLATIRKIEVDEGKYFILNDHDKLVYVFDAEGNYLNQIGRIGRGHEKYYVQVVSP